MILSFSAYNRMDHNRMPGNEFGSAKWGEVRDFNEKYAAKDTGKTSELSAENKVLSQNVRFRYDSDTLRNNNVFVVGGSGAGKTAFFLTPNLMSLHDCNVYTDPKGGLAEELGAWLSKQKDTRVYTLNLCEMDKSMHFNPFPYIRNKSDITKLVTNLIQNTNSPNIKNSSADPFWEKAEKMFGLSNLYDIKNANLLHFINQALKANYAMKKDFDYVVNNGEVLIVDQFTGRLMKGRQFSEGLHQAIEAKENVKINEETKTLATITFQNLFRMYNKLSGMTGTAKTEEEEFREIYNMYVICIPTNKPVIRIDCGDLLYATKKGKYKAIVEEIKQRHLKGQPVLVGTIAVETSELISEMLKKAKIPHEVLNAKNHEREAEIIAKAGEKGAVTIATNMAGRGTDIKLGEGVKELGGLFVLGTERHESRRIDNQLRGRSGRQGDPGESQFCVSFEDDLMVRFGTDRAKTMLQSMGFDDDMSIRNRMLSGTIESAQKRVEGNNFDIRKNLLQYDDVISGQRKIIYEKRNEILDSDSIHDIVLDTFHEYAREIVENHTSIDGHITAEAKSELIESVNELLRRKIVELPNTKEEMIEYITDCFKNEYNEKIKDIPKEITNEFEKAITLRVIDTHWMDHINTMAHLEEGIGLRGYAQENPIRAYTQEGFELFDNMLDTIDKEVTTYLLKAEIRQNTERKEVVKGHAVDGKESASKPKKVEKVGRNDPCPCGSGRKYKQCCGK